jgi:Mce-associated membrane protein
MEGDAGTGRLNPDDVPDVPDDDVAHSDVAHSDVPDTDVPGGDVAGTPQATRLSSRSWFVGVCAALVVTAALVATAGYFVGQSNRDAGVLARDEAAATAAAKDCVAATQAPDTAAMAESQQKILDCATGDYQTQATLYSGVLVEAYQAANAQVEVTDMEAAVERHNDDGSMDVLVALRVKLTNTEVQQQETGYRLRVQMAQDEGTYKIARLDQVTT